MAAKVRNVPVKEVQIDEVFGFVGCLQQNTLKDDLLRGDQYAYLAIERGTKLILHTHVGKRDTYTAHDFLGGLKRAVSGEFQITSDGFEGYCSPHGGVGFVFGKTVHYATEIKTYGLLHPGEVRRFNPVVCKSVRRKARIGEPDMARATTNHAERTNLSVRLFNRRFTRKTMGFSRKLENHRWSVILLAAHFNFCRVHSALGMTPAMAAGITDHAWTLQELLTSGK
jgi:IS1 family transposase